MGSTNRQMGRRHDVSATTKVSGRGVCQETSYDDEYRVFAVVRTSAMTATKSIQSTRDVLQHIFQ